ncbi:hypothetical protein Rs2_35765 [Raphanus sativus]|nr:hypothetical protein Rs2_35765 [Raphanus sativus]
MRVSSTASSTTAWGHSPGKLGHHAGQLAGQLDHSVGDSPGELGHYAGQLTGELSHHADQLAGELDHSVGDSPGELGHHVGQLAGELGHHASRLARRARPSREPARPASSAITQVGSPGELDHGEGPVARQSQT